MELAARKSASTVRQMTMSDGGDYGERAALDWLARLLPGAPDGETWFGDDAAVITRPSGECLLFATDCVVAGVHFDARFSTSSDVGWKALSANVSDIAAMGGDPIAAVISVAGPRRGELEGLYAGLIEAAAHYSCPLVGGDLSAASELVVSIAILGTCDKIAPILRSGAKSGDRVFVTGTLGASAAGLRLLQANLSSDGELERAHLRPIARLAEGRAAAAGGATAMIDISDGLSRDLDRLAIASKVGLYLGEIPVAVGATIEEALGGGEDYELAFTAPDRDAVNEAFDQAGLTPPTEIGRCTSAVQERSLLGSALVIKGYEHHIAMS